ncbi:glycosyltransferase [Methanobacterium sp.]|uniref:glycosyltransferase n=1 Tax=Methanobacterium sp. TaxID=2164 RepID=UPI003C73536B
MKILIIVDSLALGGGAEKFAAFLGNEFHRNNHKIYYLTSYDDDLKYNFKGEYLTFNESRFKNIFSKIKDFFIMSYKISRICKKNEINLVIGVGEVANFRAILSKYFGNTARIYTSHHLYPESRKTKYDRIKFLYPKADKVICVSKAIKDILHKRYGLNNLLTVYNMIDVQSNLKKADEEIPKEYKETFNEDFVFITIGRLSFQKGQWFLIRSFKKVADKHKDAKLCILGDGDLKPKLIQLIKELNLEKNVFLLGNQENIYPFLKMSKCFVLSSLLEGFPLTLIETLSMDLPIISTDCKTGPRECLCPDIDIDQEINYPYFGEHGILIKPFEKKWKDSEEKLDNIEEMLYDLMIKMIENPDLRKEYSKGLNRAKDFDKDKIINQWEKLIVNY